ncbi:MAG: hypothetical protein IKL84_07925 [Clostridia bacterium]|nr:hypothetical protein [Clostridia bacterium]
MSHLQRIGERDIIGRVYAEKSLDRFAFRVSGYAGSTPDGGRSYTSNGQWLVFPASGAGEASQVYWTWIWESWQNLE